MRGPYLRGPRRRPEFPRIYRYFRLNSRIFSYFGPGIAGNVGVLGHIPAFGAAGGRRLRAEGQGSKKYEESMEIWALFLPFLLFPPLFQALYQYKACE